MTLVLGACSLTSPGSSPDLTPTVGAAGSASASPGVQATPSATAAPATPTGEPVLGVDWRRIYAVEQPAGDPLATPAPAPSASNRSEHPEHYTGGEADLMDVAAGGPGMVAAGYFLDGPVAMVWTSTRAERWSLAPGFPRTEGSIAYAIAAGPGGLVAGGVVASDAAIWTSPDGSSWRRIESAAFHDADSPLEIRAIAWTGKGWLAAGFAGGIVHDMSAAFWWSADGQSWQRVDAQADFVGGRVEDLAVGPHGIVAVGSVGTYREAAEGAIWHSTDGRQWQRVPPTPELADGVVRGVTVFGDGYVAVGSALDATAAMAWTSSDGVAWERAPSDPSLDNFGLKILMQDVTTADGQLIAGGHLLQGTQYSVAVMWRSSDGSRWERAPNTPALAQGLIEGVAPGGPGAVAVGSYGAPDFFIPTVWISPAWPDI